MKLRNGDIITFKKEREIRSSPTVPIIGLNEEMLKHINSGGIHTIESVRYYARAGVDIFGIVDDDFGFSYAGDWVESKFTQTQLAEDLMV